MQRNVKSKKSKGNIAATLIVFGVAFIVFCIFAVDLSYIVTSRFKTQKITENIALYFVSILNSKPEEQRTKEALKPYKEKFESLYSNPMNGYYDFKITDIEIKNETHRPKIKIDTRTVIPSLFLRYSGTGVIKIFQRAYAKAEEETMAQTESDTNSYTFEAKEIITDKRGDDIKVNYAGSYFIFAGLKDNSDLLHWAELGIKSKNETEHRTLFDGANSINAFCTTGESTFDLSKNKEGYPPTTIGLVKYIKIYKVESCAENPAPDPAGTEGGTGGTEAESKTPQNTGTDIDNTGGAEVTDTDTPVDGTEDSDGTGDETTDESDETGSEGDPPVVTVLNSVKLIKASEYNTSNEE